MAKSNIKSAVKLRAGGRGSKGKTATRGKAATQSIKPDALSGWKARLSDIIKERGTNPRRVSIECGLSPSTVRQILHSTRSAGVDTMNLICQHLKIDMHWLITGEGQSSTNELGPEVQRVPVIAWGDIATFIDGKGECEAMRTEITERITPSERRFRLDVSGRSMEPMIRDGDTIDCSGALTAEPDDIVVAWSAKQRQFLVRRVLPTAFGERGTIKTGVLSAENKAWPEVRFDADDGDRILAVVFDVVHPIKRLRSR